MKSTRTEIRMRSRQRGQSSTEYIVVVAFAILVLIQGGSSAPVTQVTTALRDAYEGFAYAISYATDINAL